MIAHFIFIFSHLALAGATVTVEVDWSDFDEYASVHCKSVNRSTDLAATYLMEAKMLSDSRIILIETRERLGYAELNILHAPPLINVSQAQSRKLASDIESVREEIALIEVLLMSSSHRFINEAFQLSTGKKPSLYTTVRASNRAQCKQSFEETKVGLERFAFIGAFLMADIDPRLVEFENAMNEYEQRFRHPGEMLRVVSP